MTYYDKFLIHRNQWCIPFVYNVIGIGYCEQQTKNIGGFWKLRRAIDYLEHNYQYHFEIEIINHVFDKTYYHKIR